MVGDTVGLVDVPSLKGIHYAMQSGIYAARAAFEALKRDDTSGAALAAYDRMLDDSYIMNDLYRTRNMRLAFKDGLVVGGVKAGLMTVTGGRFPGGRITMAQDAEAPREVAAGDAIRARQYLDVQQGGRGLQVGQRDARHGPVPPDCGQGHFRRSCRLLFTSLSCRRLRAGR